MNKSKFIIFSFLISFLASSNVFGVENVWWCSSEILKNVPGGSENPQRGSGSPPGNDGSGGASEGNGAPPHHHGLVGHDERGGSGNVWVPIAIVGGVAVAGFGIYKLVTWGNKKHETEGTIENSKWEHRKVLKTYLPKEKEAVFTDEEIESINKDLIANRFVLDLSREDQKRRIASVTPFDKVKTGTKKIKEKVTKKIIDPETGEEKIVIEEIEKEVDVFQWKCRYVEYDWAVDKKEHSVAVGGSLDTPRTWPEMKKDSGKYPQKIESSATYSMTVRYYNDKKDVAVQPVKFPDDQEFSRWKEGETVRVIYTKFGDVTIQKK